jgi:cytochrome bd ubiquinol oxidase subunit I
MTDLIAARSQMAMSLGFHIVFAAIGIAMPLMMTIAEWKWLRTADKIYLTLAKRWAKGTAILFAVGAVSGTVLSFELGLLWPSFMNWAGALIGPLFAWVAMPRERLEALRRGGNAGSKCAECALGRTIGLR